MKFLKWSILAFTVIFLSGCTSINLESVESPSFTECISPRVQSLTSTLCSMKTEIPDKTVPSKEEIISAFRFWINFNAWKYDQNDFIDQERVVEIYYERNNPDYARDDDYFLGYLFFPYEENGKTLYEKYVFIFNEEGFSLEPSETSEAKTISKKLIYLGRETFYLAKKDVTKPVFPASSPRKEKLISRFKQKIIETLPSYGSEKAEYKVYIQNFTNVEDSALVLLVKNGSEISYGEVRYGEELDDGSFIDEVYFNNLRHGPGVPDTYDWNDEDARKRAEKIIELSVCDFSVAVP